jgi:hypothetical protein
VEVVKLTLVEVLSEVDVELLVLLTDVEDIDEEVELTDVLVVVFVRLVVVEVEVLEVDVLLVLLLVEEVEVELVDVEVVCK